MSLDPRIRLGCIWVRIWPDPALAVVPWFWAGAGLVWAHAEPAIKAVAARPAARCIISMSSSVQNPRQRGACKVNGEGGKRVRSRIVLKLSLSDALQAKAVSSAKQIGSAINPAARAARARHGRKNPPGVALL